MYRNITDREPVEHLVMPRLVWFDTEAFPTASSIIDVTQDLRDHNQVFGQIVLKFGTFKSESIFHLQKRVQRGDDRGPQEDRSLTIRSVAEMLAANQFDDYLSIQAIELGHIPLTLARVVIEAHQFSQT